MDKYTTNQQFKNIYILDTLSKAAVLQGKRSTAGAHHPLLMGMDEHHAASPSGHLPAPPPPRVTVWLLAIMMKHDYLGGTIPDPIRLTQHEVQHTIKTLTYSIYLVY